MRNDDFALIQCILAGDENAFENLIKKYQKQVHALAFRKVGNFQTAEDITQETFLRVYQKLATLNDPAKFPVWLYAIVNHLCIAWHRKNRLQTESLQEVHISEIETDAYSQYVAVEHAKTTAEAQRDLVRKLLTKLKESDQQVITLHYFEEMTSSEIGAHLGVSENTIKSRLHRARQQLKRYQFMIQEELGITVEGDHRSQKQLKGGTIMTDETKNDSKPTVDLEEMQRQIADLQEQLQVIADESDAFLSTEKREAMSTLCRLPHNAERPITWSYGGSYRTAAGKMWKRISLWTDSIDNFLSRTPDAAIANLAGIFANPTVIAILRQLVEGKKSVEDLAHGCDIPEGEIEKAVEILIDAQLADRTEDNLIEPKHDALFYFLNFVGMTRVHLDPKDH
ncbi:sigma-70 family RNA polymerase sigma factor [Candidatus Poribacteria bacterium]|nr:sigma-70 family RNA polymerase sigma factor [Candidatus Poribacteria bacterium]